MKLSIVVTLYRSSLHLSEFYKRITECAKKITTDYEIIFVNDGSPDDSLDKAIQIHEDDYKVRVIELSRNFGHHNAIMAGLNYASGEKIFLIDVDLEDPPELLNDFWQVMKNNNYDVVYGYQENRKGSLIERFFGDLFWHLMNWASNTKVFSNPCTVRLMSKQFVKQLLRYSERELYLAGIFSHAGFKQHRIAVNKNNRSKSTYSFDKKINLFVKALTGFSNAPLIAAFYCGTVIFCISSLFVAYLVLGKIINPDRVLVGWSSLLASVWMIGGITIMAIGVLGLYIGKIFTEVKNRPSFIVKNIHTKKIKDS